MLAELVKNGDFSDAERWDLGNGWSVSNGRAVFSQVSNRGSLEQALEIVVGQTYLITFDVLSSTVSGATVSVGGANEEVSGTGAKSYTLTAVTTAGISFWPGTLEGSGWEIDNVSVLYQKDFSRQLAHESTFVGVKEITKIIDASEYQGTHD